MAVSIREFWRCLVNMFCLLKKKNLQSTKSIICCVCSTFNGPWQLQVVPEAKWFTKTLTNCVLQHDPECQVSVYVCYFQYLIKVSWYLHERYFRSGLLGESKWPSATSADLTHCVLTPLIRFLGLNQSHLQAWCIQYISNLYKIYLSKNWLSWSSSPSSTTYLIDAPMFPREDIDFKFWHTWTHRRLFQ